MSKFEAHNFRPYTKNTLRGFFDLQLPSGMILKGCTLHQKSENDRWWTGLPAKEFRKEDGSTGYANIIDFVDKQTAFRFGDAATEAARVAFDACPASTTSRPAGGFERGLSDRPF